MFDDGPEAKWKREFAELGAAGVRNAMVSANWDQHKRHAARRWLERQDVNAWQAKRTPADVERKPLKQRLREGKWWLLIFGTIAIGMVASRVFRFF